MEEKFKSLEGDATIVHSTSRSVDDFIFNVGTSQALLAQTSMNEWVVDSSCTHHMDKDGSLLSPFDNVVENKIFVAGNFALNIVGHGDIACRHGWIINVFHVPSLSANLLSGSQLTKTGEIV